MLVLGIESSCDETAAAVVSDGRTILSSIIASQIKIHSPFGGVVPELASRRHLEVIADVVDRALSEANVAQADIDAVAVTRGPGLVGCLLVGFNYGKAYAMGRDVPWIGVDHLQGHLHSALLCDNPPPFPFVALLASGGHTGIYYMAREGEYELLGQTRDDAAGEAYDKVSKMLGLGYPGGAVIEELATHGDEKKIAFTRPYLDKSQFDFSFSGLKSAVLRHLQIHPDVTEQDKADIAAAFQKAVIDVLVFKLLQAAKQTKSRHVAVVGGVAANKRLREILEHKAFKRNISVHMPPLALCGDNAAMIASAGYTHLMAGKRGRLSDDVYSRIPRPTVIAKK